MSPRDEVAELEDQDADDAAMDRQAEREAVDLDEVVVQWLAGAA